MHAETQPDGYLAVSGEPIQPIQHNPPLEDIAAALTGSLPRNGSAPMAGPLKLLDGSAALPSLAFISAASTGMFRTANGIGFAIGGNLVMEIGSGGLAGRVPVAAGFDYWDDVAPSRFFFPYGQNLVRAEWPELFAKWGTRYGAGDGSTTFGVPDKSGRASFAADNMGGTAKSRLQIVTTITTSNASAAATVGNAGGLAVGMFVTSANVPSGTTIAAISGNNVTLSTGVGVTAGSAVAARFSAISDAQTLGAAGGSQTSTLILPQTPAHDHGGVSGPAGAHNHDYTQPQFAAEGDAGLAKNVLVLQGTAATSTAPNHSHSIPSAGGGQPHNILPPGIVCNYIIYGGN